MKVSHILYLSEKNGQNPFSGAENHVLTLLRTLAERGVDTELIVLLWNPGPTIARRLAELREAGIKVHTIERDIAHAWKGRLWRALGCWAALARVLRDRRDRIVHIHLDLIAVVLAAVFGGCKRVVISIHNDEPCYARWRWRVWLRWIDRWTCAYIAITDHVRSYYLRQAAIVPEKIRTIYYGVEPPARSPLGRRDIGLPTDRFVVGFIGRLTHQKNIELLLDAMAQLPGAFCAIIGDGELRAHLEGLTKARALSNVRFLGAIPDAARLMPLFDVFCLPSRWEGLGLVLAEAMLQRVPIVGSRAGAIPEILGNGRFGAVIDPEDSWSLADALRHTEMCPETVKQRVENAYEHARSEFAVERMAARTIEVYQAL